MITYRYKGRSASGAPIEGVVEAFDKQDALIKAKENCRVLESVERVSGGKLDDIMKADLGVLISGGKIKPKKLTLLCSPLSPPSGVARNSCSRKDACQAPSAARSCTASCRILTCTAT